MVTLTRSKSDETFPTYSLTSERGTLSYDHSFRSLSADGDLPPWVVADGYAWQCNDALMDGEDALWERMQGIYLDAIGDVL